MDFKIILMLLMTELIIISWVSFGIWKLFNLVFGEWYTIPYIITFFSLMVILIIVLGNINDKVIKRDE